MRVVTNVSFVATQYSVTAARIAYKCGMQLETHYIITVCLSTSHECGIPARAHVHTSTRELGGSGGTLPPPKLCMYCIVLYCIVLTIKTLSDT